MPPAGTALARAGGKITVDVADKRHAVIVQIGYHHLSRRRQPPVGASDLYRQMVHVNVQPVMFRAFRGDQHELAATISIEYPASEGPLDILTLILEQGFRAGHDGLRPPVRA